MFQRCMPVLFASFSLGWMSFTLSGSAVLMVLVGGAGTLIGPILGTCAYVLIQSGLSSYTDRWQMFLGILFVVFVMFVRGGMIGDLRLLLGFVAVDFQEARALSRANPLDAAARKLPLVGHIE